MMKSEIAPSDTLQTLLSVVARLLRGDRYSRRTLAQATGKSLPTADRWLELLAEELPDVRRIRERNTTWLVYDGRPIPPRSAATGVCIAASLGALFEGSQQERALKDARDYVLRQRGETFADLDRKFVLAVGGGESALPEAGDALDAVINALLENRRLSFQYTHNDRRVEDLTIEPLSLVVFDHQFYVLTRIDAGAYYPYRFARMKRVTALEDEFSYPQKGEYDPKTILAPAFGIHIFGSKPIVDVEVVLSGAWANYALTHRWHPSQRARRLDAERVSVTLKVQLCRELETWVLGFGEQAVARSPHELVEAVGRRLREAAAAYVETTSSPAEPVRVSTKRARARRTPKARTK
jgi:predicted DNA-binding transcriptional regulator YafY